MKVLVVLANSNPTSFNHAIVKEFTRGLHDAGHEYEVVDLYAIKFDPVFTKRDGLWFFDHTVPEDLLEENHFREHLIESAGGPMRRFLTRRAVRGKTTYEIIELLLKQKRSTDVLEQQAKVAWADGLVFVAPSIWMGFPAIMHGWIERVLHYGFIYRLTPEGWRGDVGGRIPLMQQRKALVINTTFFSESDYKDGGWDDAMRHIICDWGLTMPGVKHVEHEFFYAVVGCDDATRRRYLARAYELGRNFEPAATQAESPATAA